MACSRCFSLGGNLDFLEFLKKKFYNINYRCLFRPFAQLLKVFFLFHSGFRHQLTKWWTQGNETFNKCGQWLWHSWQHSWLRYQRTRVRIQSSATFTEQFRNVNCLWKWRKRREAKNDPKNHSMLSWTMYSLLTCTIKL